MCKLITLGETMAVFAPPINGPLRYAHTYNSRIAGAESNVAIGVMKLGHQTGWISKVGNDEFGHFILNSIRGEGVDTSQVKFDDSHPSGIMFKQSSSSNETKVFYYRSNSAASFLSPEDISEDYIKKAKILHLTGITPVLSDNCKNAVYRAIEIAKNNNVLLSFDPNIRLKLWKDIDYSQMIKDIMFSSNIVLLGLDEAKILLDTKDMNEIFKIIFSHDSSKYLAVKNGAQGAWVGNNKEKYHIPPTKCNCIDPVGAGDAFNSGFLCGILEDYDIKKCGQLGGLLGALATQTIGDIEGYPSRDEMLNILNNTEIIYR